VQKRARSQRANRAPGRAHQAGGGVCFAVRTHRPLLLGSLSPRFRNDPNLRGCPSPGRSKLAPSTLMFSSSAECLRAPWNYVGMTGLGGTTGLGGVAAVSKPKMGPGGTAWMVPLGKATLAPSALMFSANAERPRKPWNEVGMMGLG